MEESHPYPVSKTRKRPQQYRVIPLYLSSLLSIEAFRKGDKI
ncbi:unnamed protein product [Acanthoscelides obtectus]|uniref:Uncharacterized protein n=1 Tax=Acanthoscelides obtectus TaxID=200917 RepID=A0A9P0MHS9_ACAOB|nr:unnamed protein product [Acanthoscelides obtectus]CAK1652126.1 hypothetical protein AOBTE_LOCUS17701 [Acanthoscelides obtectus]